MPRYDRTGPRGEGSGTGRKQGPCYTKNPTENSQPLYRNRTSENTEDKPGLGRGRGRRNRSSQNRR